MGMFRRMPSAPLVSKANCVQQQLITQAPVDKATCCCSMPCSTLTLGELHCLQDSLSQAVSASLSCVAQQSAGFPEIEADAFLDWNSQASGATSADQAPSAGDPASDIESTSSLSQQKYNQQQQQQPGSLIWESAGLVPRLKLPVLVNREQATTLGRSATPSIPPDMPSGPSIATARVKHPLSSTESAALTQLRAELNALFAEAHRGPDLSLVPLPRQLHQATVSRVVVDSKAVKVARPNRLQPRTTAAILRSNSRRCFTADAAVPKAARTRNLTSAESTQAPCNQAELRQQGMIHPAVTQQAMSRDAADHEAVRQQAEATTVDKSDMAASPYVNSDANALQPSPKCKKYGRSNSWAAGSSPTRIGVTLNGATSTSYSR